jgi:hypothetical protein
MSLNRRQKCRIVSNSEQLVNVESKRNKEKRVMLREMKKDE